MEKVMTVRPFKSGNSQAVRIPKEFRLPDDELRIEKIGSVILLIPNDDPWKLFGESINGFSDDFFADGRNQPEMQKRPAEFGE